MAYDEESNSNNLNNNNNNNNDNNNNIIANDSNDDIVEIGEPQEQYNLQQQEKRTSIFIRKPKTTVTLTPESYETIKQLAFKHGLPPKKFIELMLADYIENNESNRLLKYIHERKDKLKAIIEAKNKDIANEIGFLLNERETSDPVTLAQHILDLSSTINRITDYKAEKAILDLMELATALQYHQHLAVVEKALYLDNRDKKLDALEAKLNSRLDAFATNTASAIARAVEPLYQNNSNDIINTLASKFEELRERIEMRAHTAEIHVQGQGKSQGINYQSLIEEQVKEYLTTSIEGQKLVNQLFKEWLGEKIKNAGNNNNNSNNSIQQAFTQALIPVFTQLLTNMIMNIPMINTTNVRANTNINNINIQQPMDI